MDDEAFEKAVMGRHYDFIEIGTSDFGALIQTAGPEKRGLSVEPLKEYLDRLPNKPGVTKVNAAVSWHSGEMTIFHIPDDVRRAHGLPSWVKGTNKVGAPHPTVVRLLTERGLPLSLIKETTVPVLSVEELFEDYHIASVDFLKVDTEGHDCIILSSYLDLVDSWPQFAAKRICFEANSLTPKADRDAVAARLRSMGYKVSKLGSDMWATR
jgi:FkbM family methyltransferase